MHEGGKLETSQYVQLTCQECQSEEVYRTMSRWLVKSHPSNKTLRNCFIVRRECPEELEEIDEINAR